MRAWRRSGRLDNPSQFNEGHLKNYKTRVPCSKPKGPPRWKVPEVLFAVANFINEHRLEMQELLQNGETLPELTQLEALATTQAMQASLAEAEAELWRLKDAKRKKQARDAVAKEKKAKEATKKRALIKALKAKATAAAKERNNVAKAAKKYAQKKDEIRKELKPTLRAAERNNVAGELKRSNTLRNGAHAAKRSALSELSAAEVLSEKRLKRAQTAEENLSEAREKIDDYATHFKAALAAKTKYTAVVDTAKLVENMPTWRPVFLGKGEPQYDRTYRVAVYQQHANGTPLSAVGPNIVNIVRLAASWLKPQPPSHRFLVRSRFELRTIEECLGAREVAAAYRVRMLGVDETCKHGDAAITSNVLVEPTAGAELKVVILRGVYLSGGGTAEAISKAVQTKAFERLRDHLRGWRKTFERKYPDEEWTGPDPKGCALGRLGGGGALMADNCNTAQKMQTLLAVMIGEEVKEAIGDTAWAAMSEAEQAHAARVHKLNCWNHLRNIFLNPMSKAQADLVAEELKEELEQFTAWERMSTSFDQLLRSSYKEFHRGNKYYKGKGREFWAWMREHYPTTFVMALERAEGGRQDLDYDAAIPLYILRPYFVEFLHGLVFGADHSNILEDFLYVSWRSNEFIAMTRANAIVDLVISMPMRWLSGNSYKLDNWSPISMRVVLGLVLELLQKVAADGSVLLDPNLDIFKAIADQQPLFADWRKHMYEHKLVGSADGSTYHLAYSLARDEIFSPVDESNRRSRQKTIDYLEKQAAAAILKIQDPKIALARNLPASTDEGCAGDALAHADCMELDATNDRLAESIFGVWDYILRRCPGITIEAASALLQSKVARSFEPDGRYWQLPEKEADALFEYARKSLTEMRQIDRAHHAELDAYHAHKRKTNSQIELDALVKAYALALSFFDRWEKRGVRTVEAMRKALDALGDDNTQAKLDYLREQIEMRVYGLGFDEFKPAWSSSKDADVGTVADLEGLLRNILMEERDRQAEGTLPDAAVVPQMRRKTFKELGTPTVQAEALATQVLKVDAGELLQKAEQKRQELQDAGEIDEVGDNQPELAPPVDDSLIGTWLEIRWRYWEKLKGDKKKRQKRAVDIWCDGEVVQIANGTTDKESPKCKKLLAAGAVRIRWPADPEREEPESYTWCILAEANWNQEAVLGWRYTAAELKKLDARRPTKKRRS